jgi:hypothetical protein
MTLDLLSLAVGAVGGVADLFFLLWRLVPDDPIADDDAAAVHAAYRDAWSVGVGAFRVVDEGGHRRLIRLDPDDYAVRHRSSER